jgi:hypothetical protein
VAGLSDPGCAGLESAMIGDHHFNLIRSMIMAADPTRLNALRGRHSKNRPPGFYPDGLPCSDFS